MSKKAWWETKWASRLPWVMTVTAMILLVSSFVLDLSPIPYTVNLSQDDSFIRAVGFAPALNWSFTYIVLAPFAFRLLMQFIRELRLSTFQLGAFGMLYDKKGHKLPEKILFNKWVKRQSKRDLLMAVLLVIAFAASMYEWWDFSGGPLWCAADYNDLAARFDNCSDKIQENEIDWSVAALFVKNVNPYANMVFSFVAYLLQTIMYTVIASTLVYVALFSTFLGRTPLSDAPLVLLDLKSLDPRKRYGFELFERPANKLMLLTAVIYVALFMSILQNGFLRSTEPNIMAYFGSLYVDGYNVIFENKPFFTLFSLSDFSSIVAIIGAAMLLGGGTAYYLFVMRDNAQYSQALSDQFLRNKQSGNEYRKSVSNPETMRKNIQNMQYWPLGYIELGRTYLWLGVAFVSLMFPQFFIVAVIGTAISIIRNFIKIKKSKNTSL